MTFFVSTTAYGALPAHLAYAAGNEVDNPEAVVGPRPSSATAPEEPPISAPDNPTQWLTDISRTEPDVASCVEAALNHYSDHEEPLRDLLRRARRSHWLPTSLRLGGVYRHVREDEWRYHVDQSFDETDLIDTTDVEDRLLDQRDSYVEIRLQLEWRLSELRHSDDEVAIRRLERSRSDDQRELAELVLELFYERRRSQLDYLEAVRAESLHEAARLALEIEHQTAMLGDLTGGWFIRELTVRSNEGSRSRQIDRP